MILALKEMQDAKPHAPGSLEDNHPVPSQFGGAFPAHSGGVFLSFNLPQSVAHAAATNNALTTYRNDNAHTGQYPNETLLNTSNVNVSQFGKRVSYPVDGQIYAQPLYLPNLTIGGAVHNVVFAETENDSVYAFDADQTSAVAPL